MQNSILKKKYCLQKRPTSYSVGWWPEKVGWNILNIPVHEQPCFYMILYDFYMILHGFYIILCCSYMILYCFYMIFGGVAEFFG